MSSRDDNNVLDDINVSSIKTAIYSDLFLDSRYANSLVHNPREKAAILL